MEFDFGGIFLLIIGVLLILWQRKRRFDRTNAFGTEQFPNYWKRLMAKTNDAAISGTAVVSLTAGLLILAFQHQDSWGWIVLLPVYALMLFLLFGI